MPPPYRVLLFERDLSAGRALARFLGEPGAKVAWAESLQKALNHLDDSAFEVLIIVGRAGDGEAKRLLAHALERDAELCVLVLLPAGEDAFAAELESRGAYECLVHPFSRRHLAAAIGRGRAHQALRRAHEATQRQRDERHGLGALAGNSPAMARLYNQVRALAASGVPALITGEPGTGHDTVARAIHTTSDRYRGPFIAYDPRGGSGPVQESTLLGGLSAAAGGTVYLDHLDALHTAVQAVLAEWLAKGAEAGEAPARLIASAEAPLRQLMRVGALDPALARALEGGVIELPPLRARPGDLPALAAHLLRQENAGPLSIAPAALDVLAAYPWPGNVNEFRDALLPVAQRARGGALGVADLPEEIRRGAAQAADGATVTLPVGTPMDDAERALILATLRATGYNKQQCASTLGIGLRTLYRKLDQYGLK